MVKSSIALFALVFCAAQPVIAGFIPGFEPVWEKYRRASLPAPSGGTNSGSSWTDPTTGMEFVFVKGGCFQMGSPASETGRDGDEGPVHEVCVDDFYLGKTEVTVAQFRRFVEATGYRTEAESGDGSYVYKGAKWEKQAGVNWRRNALGDGPADDRHPVVHVSWNDAVACAKWLAGKSGRSLRLPTEAEWEYAARAGTRSARFWGEDSGQACRYANVADRTAKRKWSGWTVHDCDDGYETTAAVGSFLPNGLGLFDMLGNVWEWCSDWYGNDYYGSSLRNNPQGPTGGSYRVLRGGSWRFGPEYVRSAFRGGGAPDYRYVHLGFRLAFPAR
ncbi:formylglycine-generating enzyme family protein [Desulfuromonas carbonis]